MKALLLQLLVLAYMLLPMVGMTEVQAAAQEEIEQHLYIDPKFISQGLPAIRIDHPGTQSNAEKVVQTKQEQPAPKAEPAQEKVAPAVAQPAQEKIIPIQKQAAQVIPANAGVKLPEQPLEDYRLRSGAKLRIKVFGDDELSGEYNIRPDGKLLFPLIGEVYCHNRTVDDVIKEMEARLDDGYLVDPRISIDITKLGTTRVYVLGEVKRAGLFELEKSHNLLDAIGIAGGFTEKAAKRRVYVSRRGMDDFVMQVNMLDLMKEGFNGANVELQEKDCVYVSSNHKLGFAKFLSAFYSFAASWERIDDVRKE